jgi:hypothetical protein
MRKHLPVRLTRAQMVRTLALYALAWPTRWRG